MVNGKTDPKKTVVPKEPITPIDKLMADLLAESQAVESKWQATRSQLRQSIEATEVLEEQSAILRGQAQALEVAMNKTKEAKK